MSQPKNNLISTADRGFRFGDGVFETVAVYAGVAYQLEWHLERLKAGLAAIKIVDPGLVRDDIVAVITKNAISDGFVRIMVSRGVGSMGYLPKPGITPTVIIEAFPRSESAPQSAELFLSSYQKPSLSALPVNFKLAQGLNSTLARMEAQEAGCFEALQLDAEGSICEASSANIFWVKDGTVFTPPLDTGCLNGSTRAALMRLGEVHEMLAPLSALEQADEVFLTNSNWQLLPVTALKPMGWQWQAGTITAQLHQQLKDDITQYVRQYP